MGVLEQFGLEGQVAVVTGAGKGIGRGIALCLAEAGADVAVAARNEAEIKAVASEIHALGRRAIAVPTDVTEEGALEALAKSTIDGLGSLTIWVNNAGGIPDTTARYLTKLDGAAWDSQLDLNLKAVWAGSKVAAGAMSESGGSIINISSTAGLVGGSRSSAYPASKGAVRLLTKSTAIQYGKEGIRCNSIHPGAIDTAMLRGIWATYEESEAHAMASMALDRLGTSEDIAYGALYLASDEASYVTGAELVIDGGMTAQ